MQTGRRQNLGTAAVYMMPNRVVVDFIIERYTLILPNLV